MDKSRVPALVPASGVLTTVQPGKQKMNIRVKLPEKKSPFSKDTCNNLSSNIYSSIHAYVHNWLHTASLFRLSSDFPIDPYPLEIVQNQIHQNFP